MTPAICSPQPHFGKSFACVKRIAKRQLLPYESLANFRAA
jgi:hypothetical protein